MGGSAEYQSFMLAAACVIGGFALVAVLVVPFVLRRQRKRDQAELHKRIEKAKADILEDGVVEGPKGPYVRHTPWGVGTEVGTPRSGPPRGRSYHGGPWPRAG